MSSEYLADTSSSFTGSFSPTRINWDEPNNTNAVADDRRRLAPEPVPCDLTECIRQVRCGNQRAAVDLVAQVRPIVLRIVRSRRLRRDVEEDLVQEALTKMFSRLSQYHNDAPFTHWLSRIAVRICIDHFRAQRRRPELRWADMSESKTDWIEATMIDEQSRRPGDLFAADELSRQLLKGLKPVDRTIIELFYLREKTIIEISHITCRNHEFVKMRLFRARQKLRRLLLDLSKWDGIDCKRQRNLIKEVRVLGTPICPAEKCVNHSAAPVQAAA